MNNISYMQTLISIVIPAYNAEQTLTATIESVLAQTHKNIELIIVNDGSKDDTAKVMEHYAALDPRVKTIHKENGGVTQARLTGVRAAKGQWIGFVDGDDLLDPNMYAILLKNALTYDADISHCGYNMVFPSRTVPYHGTEVLVEHSRDEAVVELLNGAHIEPGLWNKLYKKSLLLSLIEDSIMDSSIRINEDLLMNYYLFLYAQKSVFQDSCLYQYMVRAGSAANSNLNAHHLIDPVTVRRQIKEHSINFPEIYPVACNIYVRQLVALSTRSKKADPSLIRPIRKQARKELRSAVRQKLPIHKKFRIMAYWACLWPGSYTFIHALYAKAKGYDKLYEIK